jgi:Flp pilus assembly protein TadB
MEDELFIMFYVAVPIVLLAAAFVYYMYRRREDIEKAERSQTAAREEGEIRPGQHQRRQETPLPESSGPESRRQQMGDHSQPDQSQPT